MWLRDLETKAGSIVGASGCFYGVRREIHQRPLPRELSWDFASPLVAKQLGYRSVSVNDAVCIVPRTHHMQSELRRKIRTMARGIRTLFYLRTMMNPFRYGAFALMLLSHKLVRWLPYLLAPVSFFALAVGYVGLALLAIPNTTAALRTATGRACLTAGLAAMVALVMFPFPTPAITMPLAPPATAASICSGPMSTYAIRTSTRGNFVACEMSNSVLVVCGHSGLE